MVQHNQLVRLVELNQILLILVVTLIRPLERHDVPAVLLALPPILIKSDLTLPNEPVDCAEPLMFPAISKFPLPESIVSAVVEPFLNLNSVPVASVSTPINQGCVRLPLVVT